MKLPRVLVQSPLRQYGLCWHSSTSGMGGRKSQEDGGHGGGGTGGTGGQELLQQVLELQPKSVTLPPPPRDGRAQQPPAQDPFRGPTAPLTHTGAVLPLEALGTGEPPPAHGTRVPWGEGRGVALHGHCGPFGCQAHTFHWSPPAQDFLQGGLISSFTRPQPLGTNPGCPPPRQSRQWGSNAPTENSQLCRWGGTGSG